MPSLAVNDSKLNESSAKRDLKELDMRIALRIAGYAGMPTRDRHGNIIGSIWTEHSMHEQTNTQLLDVNTVRQLLLEQLKLQIEHKKDLLLDLDNPGIVARWVLDFTKEWESEYELRAKQNWDMSQTIITAMDDCISEVAEIFQATSVGLHMEYMYAKINNLRELDSENEVHMYNDTQEALTRCLFRSKSLGSILCRIAGKLLQKKQVCNRAGMYSAKVQRNDVTREVDTAIENFVQAHFEDHKMFQECKNEFEDAENLLRLCTDHTKQDEKS